MESCSKQISADSIKKEVFSSFNRDSIEARVNSWLQEKKAVTFCSGYDDDDNHRYLTVIWEMSDGSIKEYYPVEAVKAAYPNVRLVSEFILPPSHPAESFEPTELDEEALDKAEERLGGEYDNDLVDVVFPFENAIEYCMFYALADHGQSKIAPARCDPELLYDCEKEIDPEKLLSMTFHYSDRETGKGFGSSAYSFLPEK